MIDYVAKINLDPSLLELDGMLFAWLCCISEKLDPVVPEWSQRYRLVVAMIISLSRNEGYVLWGWV